jgi:hypothetical protein
MDSGNPKVMFLIVSVFFQLIIINIHEPDYIPEQL